MSSYKAKAIILKTYKLGESDKIVRMYSAEGDVISAVAKGARKINSKFGGRLELFNLVEMEVTKGRNLDIITQAEILKSFKNIASDFYKFIFCEIISKIVLKTQVPGGDSSPLLFKLIYVCFNEINNAAQEDIQALEKIMCFFEIKFLRIIGLMPLLKNCSKCNKQLENLYSFAGNKIYFSVRYGGVLCNNCANSLPVKEILNVSDYRFLYDLFNLKIEDFREIEVNAFTLKKIYKLIEDYILYHTECDISSFNYLKKLGI
ncbi:MAG: DNA repair protein RecO [Actinomycetota bacterium]|nr:DNA repair protein RecO [Actinomycetota bacterium]